jgi:hypothetical protein
MTAKLGRDELLRILRIGHDTSMRGDGISMHEAVRRSNYVTLRSSFDCTDLVPLIRENPELATEWTMYSEDKRTDGGFALRSDSCDDVADYVVRELDFWATLQ